jgi:two-component system, cell cycle sensor histidine kinase and response regulator CckA
VESFEALLDSVTDAIVLVDASGQITLANPCAEELLGYPPGELAGRDIETLLRARPRPGDSEKRTASHGSEAIVLTIVRDGSQRQADEREPEQLASARVARDEAEAGREQLASIVGETAAIIWEADVGRHRFSFVSKGAEDMLGYPLSAWLHGEGFWRRIVEPDDLPLAELYLQEAGARGRDHDHEYRLRTADGRVVWVRDCVRVARTEDGESRLRGVTVDVTVRRELEERLIEAQKMDAVGRLAGGVAHDFNNLLVVISGYTDLLLARMEDEGSLAQLREIRQAAGRASELVAQLLAFGRRAPSLTELVDLQALIRGIEPMLHRLVDQDSSLLIEIAEGLPRVRADAGQLEQVLVNLVLNARDAMPHGGEVRLLARSVQLEDARAAELGLCAGEWVLLAVADNGSGMKNEVRARIFEPFFTTKQRGKGTGLGLATAFGIIEQAGGTIAVETELGRGSTFSVYLRPAVGEEELPGPGERPRARVVLVVEDESAVRRLVRSVLEQSGYRVHEAADGRDALSYLERKGSAIDLILTDVVMPDIAGPELVARLAPLGHSTRILFMSGYADSQLLSRGLDERAIGVLHKPFTPAELSARVAEVMAEEETEPPRD